MKWIKKGLIYGPDGKSSWAKHSALQPTPILLDDETIRVYAGFRDEQGVSRIGHVDVDANNPSVVLKVSEKPVLDVGMPGTFDENGVVPCAIIERDNKLYLYYAGYQLGQKVRFYGFAGLAISDNGGDSFKRYSKVPIMDRTDEALFFRAIHSMIFDDGVWKVWYGAGSEFIKGKTKTLPSYNIRYIESNDGINFERKGIVCIDIKEDEYRVGRPYVIKTETDYKMFYGSGTESKTYALAYAESKDGIKWVRKDEKIGIYLSKSGWDSQMMAYPSVLHYKTNVYMFYNGNNYGESGFGYAVLEHW